VLSYLKDFLFTPDRAQQPVSALSGGERNRLLLARLFAQPANLLVLDEPTNDLDAETLELLEELLLGLDGTLLLVSHDRDLLDHCVTSTLVLEGAGRVGEYVGGYSDWLRQRPAPAVDRARESGVLARETKAPTAKARKSSAKLGYREQRELEQLPGRIEVLEAEQESLHRRMADPTLYQGDGAEVARAKSRLDEVETELMLCYERWEALESAQQQAREAKDSRSER
jgi:ATP-binding cassette subfamily F protein uup